MLYVLVITVVLTLLGVPMTSIVTVIGTAAGAVVTNYNEMSERRVDLVFGISYEADCDAAKKGDSGGCHEK